MEAHYVILYKNNGLTNEYRGSIISVVSHGLVAQLGERTVRIRKVEGSIPFESTNQ